MAQGVPCYCERCGTFIPAAVGSSRSRASRRVTATPQAPVPPTSSPSSPPTPSRGPVPARFPATSPGGSAAPPLDYGLATPETLEGVVKWLNAASVPFSALVLVVAFAVALSNYLLFPPTGPTVLAFWLLGGLPFGATAAAKDSREFRGNVERGDYSDRGLDMVLWGAIGCVGFGAGALLLLKGLFAFVLTRTKRNEYPPAPFEAWVGTLVRLLNDASWATLLLAVPFATFSLALPAPGFPFLATLRLLFLLVALVIDVVVLRVQLRPSQPWPVELGALALSAGVLGTLSFGAGVPVLAKGLFVVALWSRTTAPEERRVTVPSWLPVAPAPPATPVAPAPPATPVAPAPPVAPATPQARPPASPHAPPARSLPQVATPGPRERRGPPPPPAVRPVVGPDPGGGRRGPPSTGGGDRGPRGFESDPTVRAYLSRVYSVLSAEIRARLNRLPIPDAEKDLVAEELLGLTRQERAELLAELEAVNAGAPADLVGRITSLSLPPEQKKLLVGQLEYLDRKEQERFVEEVERAVHET
ncbi:MAG: hypothetical protein Kow0069_31630 [Promethearchaeota archaeon]